MSGVHVIVAMAGVVFYIWNRQRKKKMLDGTFGMSISDMEELDRKRRQFENECELTLNTDAEVRACVEAKLATT